VQALILDLDRLGLIGHGLLSCGIQAIASIRNLAQALPSPKSALQEVLSSKAWRHCITDQRGLFVLDTSTLGGADFNYSETIIQDRGRSIIINWSNGVVDQDMELFGYSVRYYPAESEPKEQV
jgi:hypothetical protein